MNGKAFGRARCTRMWTANRCCGTGSNWAAESATDDVLGAPLASVSELRYPDTAADALGTVLELADGGSLATWQGERL